MASHKVSAGTVVVCVFSQRLSSGRFPVPPLRFMLALLSHQLWNTLHIRQNITAFEKLTDNIRRPPTDFPSLSLDFQRGENNKENGKIWTQC